MHRFRALGALVVAVSITIAGVGVSPAVAADADSVIPDISLVAYLDGKSIPLKLVANYYCDDFSYPVIQCASQPTTIEARATLSLLSGSDYVTIYDQQTFNGPYMNVSQDYAALATIGWNDRISSFKVRNSASGAFSTDWFFGGSTWPFCCNSQVSTLGAYDNTFSSVERR